MLIRLSDGRVIALDGREMAPSAATRDMYVRDGKADANLSQTGALAVGIPGSVAVYEYALQQFGKLKFADLLLPAAALAESGFTIDANYARKISGTANLIAEFPETKRMLLNADGSPREAGDTLKQPELAETYRQLAANGSEYFYRGPFAKRVGEWMRQHGGIVTEADFARLPIQNSRTADHNVSRILDHRFPATEQRRGSCRANSQHSLKFRSGRIRETRSRASNSRDGRRDETGVRRSRVLAG